MKVTFGSNIAALKAQSSLRKSSTTLNSVFERLSSGMRINGAGDDPAGLAVAATLEADAKVYAQGIRNVNDGISVLSVAEASLESLSAILVRQRELATQASNGILSSEQRAALNQEANALVGEYNRIIESTEFNGLKLLDGSVTSLSLQLGVGSDNTVAFELGEGLGRGAGDGTFGNAATYSLANFSQSVDAGDFNGDGFDDVIAGDRQELFLSDGNGTLTSQGELKPFFNGYDQDITDVNNDGDLDIVSINAISNTLHVFIGNGNGTFVAGVTYSDGTSSRTMTTGDLNGDGFADVITASATDARINVFLGNGDGTYNARTALVNPSALTIQADGVRLADVDNDNDLDIIASSGSDTILVYTNDGAGSFGAASTFQNSPPLYPYSVEVGDIDGDGSIDILSSEGSEVRLRLGNGDGTFAANTALISGLNSSRDLILDDLNGDGHADIALTDNNTDEIGVYLANGDGTFKFSANYTVGNQPFGLTTADLNGDGAKELLAVSNASPGELSVLFGNGSSVNTQAELDLTTQQAATNELSTIDAQILLVQAEIGNIGAAQSRLGFSLSHLASMRQSYEEAASRIKDIDVAEETAKLVRTQVLQQAAAAILAQANQSSSIVLQLLGI